MDYSFAPNSIPRSLTERADRIRWRREKADELQAWLDGKRAEYRATHADADKIPAIADTFRGETVFITGVTGVMGKILIEKLLHSCSGIEKIFILVRPLKGMTSRERMDKQFSMNVYDRVRKENPAAFDKVCIVEGDCNQVGLGLSPEDRASLQDEVGFVFHGAASVKFDDPLRKAMLLNVRGTREVVDLARGMRRLRAFVHISTTYANTKEEVIKEEVYPPPVDWRALISAAESFDPQQFEAISHKIVGYQPNTYTFTKQLAEAVVNDARHEIPAIIARPSVVISCAHEPIVGWTDNLYGPSGICVAVMKGVLRFQYGERYIVLDYIPVDAAIRFLIVFAWIRATNQKLNPDPQQLDVVNMTVSDVLSIQYYDVEQMREPAIRVAPLSGALRYPRYTLTNCKPFYYLGLFFSHILFAAAADSLLRLSGMKPMLMSIYRQVFYANHCLLYFMLNNFRAHSDNLRKMQVWMQPEDLAAFSLPWFADEDACLRGGAESISLYKFKEPHYDYEAYRRHNKRLLIVEFVFNALLVGLLIWLVLSFRLHTKLLQGFAAVLSPFSA